jgi:hypothetical protein
MMSAIIAGLGQQLDKGPILKSETDVSVHGASQKQEMCACGLGLALARPGWRFADSQMCRFVCIGGQG